MSQDWISGAEQLPTRTLLTPEEQEEVRAELFKVGITDDIFTMDPRRRTVLLADDFVRASVYAAIKYVMRDKVDLIEGFKGWSKRVTL